MSRGEHKCVVCFEYSAALNLSRALNSTYTHMQKHTHTHTLDLMATLAADSYQQLSKALKTFKRFWENPASVQTDISLLNIIDLYTKLELILHGAV